MAFSLPSWAPATINPANVLQGADAPQTAVNFLTNTGSPTYTYNGAQVSYEPGIGYGMVRTNPDGGSTSVTYDVNGNPTDAQGLGAPGGGLTGLFDKLIQGGAIIGGTLAMPGVGSGLFGGATTPGLGAEAIGGSAADVGGAAGISAAPSAGGLASQFSNGQYVDPLFSGAPEAGVPGATGTFYEAAPLTGDTLATGISPGGGGLSLNNVKNIINTGRKVIGGINSGGSQPKPQSGGESNLGQLLTAGGLGALL